MPGYKWRDGKPQEPEEPKPKPKRPGPKPAPVGRYCGTRSGFVVHKRGGEKPCQPCKDAENAYSREYRREVQRGQRKPAATFSDDKCGTLTGYRRHLRFRVQSCEPCKSANAAYSLKWKNTRKRKRAADKAAKQQ